MSPAEFRFHDCCFCCGHEQVQIVRRNSFSAQATRSCCCCWRRKKKQNSRPRGQCYQKSKNNCNLANNWSEQLFLNPLSILPLLVFIAAPSGRHVAPSCDVTALYKASLIHGKTPYTLFSPCKEAGIAGVISRQYLVRIFFFPQAFCWMAFSLRHVKTQKGNFPAKRDDTQASFTSCREWRHPFWIPNSYHFAVDVTSRGLFN